MKVYINGYRDHWISPYTILKFVCFWEKDDDDNKKLRKMIRSVAFRNCKNTRLFKEKYPDCMKSESRYSDMYNKIIIEVMGGDPKINDIEKQNKIMRKIAKEMTIDKIHL